MNYKSFSTVLHERELQPKHKLMEKLIAFALFLHVTLLLRYRLLLKLTFSSRTVLLVCPLKSVSKLPVQRGESALGLQLHSCL